MQLSDAELDKGILTLKFIWGAMLFSLFLYLFVAVQLGPRLPVTMDAAVFAKLRLALFAVALVTPLFIPVLRRAILAAAGQEPKGNQAFRHPLLQRYASATIVSLALAETLGIYGLILFLLGHDPTDLYLLLIASAAVMIYFRPRRDEIVALAQRGPTA